MRIDTARSRTCAIPPSLTASLSLTTATLLAFVLSASPVSARTPGVARLDLRVDMRDNAATVYAGPQQHRSRPRPQLPIGGGYTPVVPADTGSSSYAPPQSTHAQSTSYGNGNGNGMPDSTSTYIPSSAYTPSSQNTVRVSPAGTGTGTGTIASTWTPPANTATDTNNGVGTGTGTVTDTGIGAGTGTTSISSWQPDTTSGASDSTGSAAASTPPAGAPEPPVAGGAGVDLTGATRSGKGEWQLLQLSTPPTHHES